MLIIRSLLFNFFIYTGIVAIFLIAMPALFLPAKITLLFGKFLGHYVVFVVRLILKTTVEFRRPDSLSPFIIAPTQSSALRTEE